MTFATDRREEAWRLGSRGMDPEGPVVSGTELGIIPDGAVDDARRGPGPVTPPSSGCPAMKVIEDEILGALAAGGFPTASVRTVFQPAWTTDWIGAEAREKLRAYGIAPPG